MAAKKKEPGSKRCGTCGACKECGAHPAPLVVYPPVIVQPVSPRPYVAPYPNYYPHWQRQWINSSSQNQVVAAPGWQSNAHNYSH